MENEIYQILKKHKLPLKKREEVLTDLLLLFSVVGRSEQFKCDCGCTNHYKNEIHDSIMCADCGTVYARI